MVRDQLQYIGLCSKHSVLLRWNPQMWLTPTLLCKDCRKRGVCSVLVRTVMQRVQAGMWVFFL